MAARRPTAVHLAAPLDVRALQDESAVDVDLDDAVAFALAMPAEEGALAEDRIIRRSAREEWLSSENAPDSEVPRTALVYTPPTPAVEVSEPPSAPVSSEPEPQVPESRELFLHELYALGQISPHALIPAADGHIEPSAVLLGRARGLRFRLALFEAWPVENRQGDEVPRSIRSRDPRFLDALLDAAVLVVFAGAEDLLAAPYPADAVLLGGLAKVAAVYAHRVTVRESGVAACARLTVLGSVHTLERFMNSIAALGAPDRGAIGNAVGTLARLAGPSEARAAMLLAIQRRLFG